MEFAGGGGWGDPRERASERVREDVVRGYVSREAARDDYGVALKDDLSVDAEATARLRAKCSQGRLMKLRIGIDVGGTFTDVTAFDEDAGALVAVRKYLSDPARPAAVMEQHHARSRRRFRRGFGRR